MKKIIVLAGVMALAGCQTLDPYTQESKTGNAAKGAGIGVIAGAVLGNAVAGKGNRTEGAIAGALVGGAIGSGIGYYMDQQEMLLRQELEGTGVRVERVGDSIRLIMPGVTFPTGSYNVDRGFYPVLDSVTKVLMKFDKTVINVDGFTDSTGSFETNQTLSERRAASVSQYLSSGGVAALRLQSRGYGERYPVASNDNSSGRALNRRVEVNIRGQQ
ncbi:OmpA family protein [Amphritea sp.]|uniref:OmpA family protein n=1 Tax=Amphritea sp. TaxID=1872502 RepID=UPI0025BFB503|nr:OmpA family protein [Amphritea sp.]